MKRTWQAPCQILQIWYHHFGFAFSFSALLSRCYDGAVPAQWHARGAMLPQIAG